MSTENLLYKSEIEINDKIKIIIPTVGQIIDDEESYYGVVSLVTAMPIDVMVALDDAGIDFTQINEWQLFLMMFQSLSAQDTSLVFGDLDLTKFQLAESQDNHSVVLLDPENDIIIDRSIHYQMADALRKVHHLERDTRKPGNDEARKYLIERARIKQRRKKHKKEESQLESLIVALVNTEQYKYDFEGTRELSIYQFNESVRQCIKKIDYDNRMRGVYAGTIDAKELSQDDLTWLTHK